ncbi:hypothetical protein D3C86_2180690 [compost metagenome]
MAQALAEAFDRELGGGVRAVPRQSYSAADASDLYNRAFSLSAHQRQDGAGNRNDPYEVRLHLRYPGF